MHVLHEYIPQILHITLCGRWNYIQYVLYCIHMYVYVLHRYTRVSLAH